MSAHYRVGLATVTSPRRQGTGEPYVAVQFIDSVEAELLALSRHFFVAPRDVLKDLVTQRRETARVGGHVPASAAHILSTQGRRCSGRCAGSSRQGARWQGRHSRLRGGCERHRKVPVLLVLELALRLQLAPRLLQVSLQCLKVRLGVYHLRPLSCWHGGPQAPAGRAELKKARITKFVPTDVYARELLLTKRTASTAPKTSSDVPAASGTIDLTPAANAQRVQWTQRPREAAGAPPAGGAAVQEAVVPWVARCEARF